MSQTAILQERMLGDEVVSLSEQVTVADAPTVGQHDWADEARLVVARLERATGRDIGRIVAAARSLGEAVDLQSKELDILSWSAALYDLGMLAVPEEIMAKGGNLEGDDLTEIRRHPHAGAEMIMDISPRLARVAEAARSHHEHWDGRGYPTGISRYEIPLHGRVLAIVDTYDALTSPRPLRRGVFTESGARDYLEAQAGKRFDPALVKAFVGVLEAADRNARGGKLLRRRKG